MHSRRVLMPSILALGISIAAAQQNDTTDPSYDAPPGGGDGLELIAVPVPGVPVSETRTEADTQPQPETQTETRTPALEPIVTDSVTIETGSAANETPSSVLTNAEIVAMVDARFSSATIVAAMDVNETRFDVSPGGLLALKNADVPDRVIEAMIRLEVDKRNAAAQSLAADASNADANATADSGADSAATVAADGMPASALADVTAAGTADGSREPARAPAGNEPGAPTATSAEPTMTPETVAMLSEAIKRLSETSSTAEKPEPARSEPAARRGPGPHAWVAAESDRITLPSTTAEVALTDNKGRGSSALSALRSLGGKALAFATPALGIASELELGGLFRNSDPKMTAVWALPGASAAREFASDTVFEIDFNNIPGVNPDDYRPKIVELVPTRDNYRLVGAARARLSAIDEGLPDEPIIEESAASEIRALGRGRYRVALDPELPPGEYALVLRPVDRARTRREDENSLGALMGSGSGEILYITWDFSVRS